MHKAIVPFGWYPDGFTRDVLAVGDVRDFGDATEGLLAAKKIAPVEKPKYKPADEPADKPKKTK